MISVFRLSDFQISGSAISSRKNNQQSKNKQIKFPIPSENGAGASAVMYSIIETAKANNLNVFQYAISYVSR